VLEGDWNPGRTVMLKFPSFEKAKRLLRHEPNTESQARAKAPAPCAWFFEGLILVEGVDALLALSEAQDPI
jgi:uncharacterized protein (DUF1330 family)